MIHFVEANIISRIECSFKMYTSSIYIHFSPSLSTVASKFNSHSIAMRIQKKVAGKLATTSAAKSFIDDDFSGLLDSLYDIVAAEVDVAKADKLVKNIIKMVVKIAILYKNNKFNDEELRLGMQLRRKLKMVAMTVVSFHEVDFSYDSEFLATHVQEIGKLTHDLVNQHLTPKSHGRIDLIVTLLGNKDLLDKVFAIDGKHHAKLPFISSVFAKVVDSTEW